ncbi:MAG TPA: RNA degradosome polyphosphate kinase [Acidimicrobiia bacterium]
MEAFETQPFDRQRVQPDRLLNRELSWLDFNARVLALAEDTERPLLERCKFLAIFSTNLDEFVQVRVSGLQEQVAAGVRLSTPDGMNPLEQLRAIRARIDELARRHAEVFTIEVAPALEAAGIVFANWEDLDDGDRAAMVETFEQSVFPVLTPLAVDPAHPFPYISNLSLNLAVVVRDPKTEEQRFARVKVPPLLPRFVVTPDGERFVPLEQVIAAHLAELFPGMEILSHHPFRVTRDADFELEDEDEDLLEAIESVLTLRKRSGHVVRLEVDTTMSEEVLELLCRELELSELDVNVVDGPLDLSGLWALYELDRPELKDERWRPQTQPVLTRTEPPPDLFRILQAGDVLVHHPYDSFTTSVEAFVDQASRDPRVLAIKQTLYRTAGPESTIVGSLVRAADAGKQVVALVELKARFDEQANLERAQELEQAGVHVVYGLVGLKTHTKILLVVREEDDGIRRYCHIGTGNYNPVTANLYEDLGLLTSDPDLGADLTELFNYLTGYSRQGQYRKLLVAPVSLRPGILERIERETAKGPDGRIVMKMNSLVDPDMVDALYAASQEGVDIDLIVRGICCLRPGVPGLSQRIRVRSIVGRFLEHSRIYRFGSVPDDAEYLIGSADLMPRNLDRRVEAITPVTSPLLQSRLDEILDTELADDVLAWELQPDGSWTRVPTQKGIDTQRALAELAVARSRDVWVPDARA